MFVSNVLINCINFPCLKQVENIRRYRGRVTTEEKLLAVDLNKVTKAMYQRIVLTSTALSLRWLHGMGALGFKCVYIESGTPVNNSNFWMSSLG